MSRYRISKTSLDFTEARDSEWQWHQLGHTQVCTSLQTDNHASTPPLSFLQAGCPSRCQTNSVKALEALYCLLSDVCSYCVRSTVVNCSICCHIWIDLLLSEKACRKWSFSATEVFNYQLLVTRLSPPFGSCFVSCMAVVVSCMTVVFIKRVIEESNVRPSSRGFRWADPADFGLGEAAGGEEWSSLPAGVNCGWAAGVAEELGVPRGSTECGDRPAEISTIR